jgi:hypothetical protein
MFIYSNNALNCIVIGPKMIYEIQCKTINNQQKKLASCRDGNVNLVKKCHKAKKNQEYNNEKKKNGVFVFFYINS